VLRVPATRSDEDIAIELLQTHGVYVHPGHFYDFPSDGFLIVSLIASQMDFSRGLESLLSFFNEGS
jgi:aspartate/methionine/tyrosine aminotransferase